jgi:type IV pilus assembly protein PilB
MQIEREELLQILRQEGVSEEQLKDAEQLSQRKKIPLAEAVVNLDILTEDRIRKYLSKDLTGSSPNASHEDDYIGEEDEASGDMAFGGEESTAPIVKIVDLILMDAYNKRASDIHIEPFENRIRVRYRVDGHLIEALTLPKGHHEALLARLKIITNLDITENRIPQDGRFKMKIGDKEVDYRVSILPLYWGGKVVMRSLDKSNLKVNLGEIGFSQTAMKNFETALKRPFGMIIVTGPTGSGKSTTLYSLLSELNSVERNLITVEDPIEYQVGGITQVAVRSDIGMTFSNALRAILRQSPDVVMIGEIRDGETADIAVKAALTGQIVLSTLHTNDAPGAIVRLRDMGVESFLISSSLTLVAAQRLCRKICDHCKEPVSYSPHELMTLGFDTTVASLIKETNFSRGRGCVRCGRTGYKGRTSITETMLLDDTMRDMIERGCSSQDLKNYAVQNGMLTLRTDALLKFAQGITTVEEVLRTTSADT